MKKGIKFLSVLTGIATGAIVSLSAYLNFTLPDKFYSSDNKDININCIIDIKGEARENCNEAQLKLFGIVPFKTVTVENIERPWLIPCGTPFGIKMLTDGVIVTAFGEVGNGIPSPAAKAGIEKGDVITKINNEKVTSSEELVRLINKHGDNLNISVQRNGRTKTYNVSGAVDNEGNTKLGLWVRDSTAGIGTMTYYDSSNKTYGGLGHAVNDVDTGQRLPLSKGEIVPAVISDILKGQSGAPGELCGTLTQGVRLGNIKANSNCGLFGFCEYAPTDNEPIAMALKQEVECGQAHIIATIDDNPPTLYSIEIESINLNSNDNKNMIIRITDEKLIDKTGGIVQGMSGSPIIQNNMLVGAVTHVFISDPSRGYAVFAETMYKESTSISDDEIAA